MPLSDDEVKNLNKLINPTAVCKRTWLRLYITAGYYFEQLHLEEVGVFWISWRESLIWRFRDYQGEYSNNNLHALANRIVKENPYPTAARLMEFSQIMARFLAGRIAGQILSARSLGRIREFHERHGR